MQEICVSVSQNQRMILGILALTIICYYLLMDSMLYTTLQSVQLVNEKETTAAVWSPFRPLSVKLLMSDPTTHYAITPLSEYFNHITKFSKIFYFITPNMITFTHLIIAFISAKFIVSESLQSRRIGVLLFELRTFLDAFDGTVHRSRVSNNMYKSDHSNFGFWFDSTCDTIGGFALCFGVLFFFWWKKPPGTDQNCGSSLPWSVEDPSESKVDLVKETPVKRVTSTYSKQYIFLHCFLFGAQIGLSSAMWDQLTMKYEHVFMTKLADSKLVDVQSAALHSTLTWAVIWLWRNLNGQSLQQIFLIAIFSDKTWEFLRFVRYLGFIVLTLLVIYSFYHVSKIKSMLEL